ncbi:MAG: hypothetical protein F6K42_04435 [Leptolyngbya sp. SIO1D8]|nr:hypothetical protein [Leptolyngbya sp. SIO1D8]
MRTKRSSGWLDIAASKGATKWLRQFIYTYLKKLKQKQLSAEAFAKELDAELLSRMLNTPQQQKNYRSNVVQALKVLDPDHPAIALVALSTEQYRVLNDQQKERVADRETRYIDDPEAIVSEAQKLLTSAEWSDVGASLAVLMGRRISEILLSEFSLRSPWSLSFSQMAKKADEEETTIEIPTLASAEVVLEAIQRLQNGLSIAGLKLRSLSTRDAKRVVNRRYSHAIAEKCEKHFSGLVPARSDKENLYTHIFRAVYATIATHWYCPPNVPEHQFKAEIQGHFTLSKEGKKLPNYAARSHYDDYAISDGQGNRDGRLGIKLGHVDDLQVIEVFRQEPEEIKAKEEDTENATTETAEIEPTKIEVKEKDSARTTTEVTETDPKEIKAKQEDTESTPAEMTETTKTMEVEEGEMADEEKQTRRPNVYADDIDRLSELMAQAGVTGTTAELFHALLNAHETQQAQQQRGQTQTIGEVAQAINWFTGEIEILRGRIAALEKERDQLQQAQEPLQKQQLETDNLTALQEENALLKRKLHETQTQLDGIQALLGGNSKRAKASETSQSKDFVATKSKDTTVATKSKDAAKTKPKDAVAKKPKDTTVAKKPKDATKTKTMAAKKVEAKPGAATTENTRQRDRGGSKAKVEGIVNDIISWNTAQEEPDKRLRISVAVIKSLGALVGATYQPVIQEVLTEQEATINDIHERFMIGNRHNARVDKNKVLQAIAKDYMGVQNWKKAKYG